MIADGCKSVATKAEWSRSGTCTQQLELEAAQLAPVGSVADGTGPTFRCLPEGNVKGRCELAQTSIRWALRDPEVNRMNSVGAINID